MGDSLRNVSRQNKKEEETREGSDVRNRGVRQAGAPNSERRVVRYWSDATFEGDDAGQGERGFVV